MVVLRGNVRGQVVPQQAEQLGEHGDQQGQEQGLPDALVQRELGLLGLNKYMLVSCHPAVPKNSPDPSKKNFI